MYTISPQMGDLREEMGTIKRNQVEILELSYNIRNEK